MSAVFLTLPLSQAVWDALAQEAEGLALSLEEVAVLALEAFLDDDLPKELLLARLQQGMREALAGQTRPIEEVLAEIENNHARRG